MHIRPFAPQDEPAVVALWQRCDLTRPWNRGWVSYLAVAPRCRGRGLARALIGKVEKLLLARGCPKVSLLVRNSNAEAIGFSRHLGYLQDDSVSLGKRLIADA